MNARPWRALEIEDERAEFWLVAPEDSPYAIAQFEGPESAENARRLVSEHNDLLAERDKIAEVLRALIVENESYGTSSNPSELTWANARAALRAVELKR